MAGPSRYQIDRTCEPKSGPLTIACEGEHLWLVYADKITRGPAEPPPSDVRELADPSWLLQCWLAGGAPVRAGDRPAYRIDVVRRHNYPFLMVFPATVAVVDAELGVIVRLTSYIDGTPVQKYELEDLATLAGEFRVDLPADLPVTEAAGPFDDFRTGSPGPGAPVRLGGVLARHAVTEAAKAARSLIDRLGHSGQRDR
jgi:hypothetical protein